MKLIDNKTGKELQIGDLVTTFRDEKAKLVGFAEPSHSGSTGRVTIQYEESGYCREFYPAVIGASIVP